MAAPQNKKASSSSRKAPKHPDKPEAKMRVAMNSLLNPTAKSLASAIANGDHGKIGELGQSLKSKLDRDSFSDLFHSSLTETAESAREQVASILGLDPEDFDVDFDDLIEESISNLHDIATGAVADFVERADDLIDEENITIEDAHDSLAGAIGSALSYVSLAFTYAFAKSNRLVQTDAGVDGYTWVTAHDGKVRPEHASLDGVESDWDHPLLDAEDSSSGDECHPGEDYNCRCTAEPVMRQESESEDENESESDEDSREAA